MQRNDDAVLAEEELNEEVVQAHSYQRWSPLLRNSLYLLGLFFVALAKAHAQGDPLSTNINNWMTILEGTPVRAAVTGGVIWGGWPLITGEPGNHKTRLISTLIGGVLMLGGPAAVTAYFN